MILKSLSARAVIRSMVRNGYSNAVSNKFVDPEVKSKLGIARDSAARRLTRDHLKRLTALNQELCLKAISAEQTTSMRPRLISVSMGS